MENVQVVPNSKTEIEQRVAAGQVPWRWPLMMLVSRLFLFAGFQALFALIYVVLGHETPWQAAAALWPAVVLSTNVTCIALLGWLARKEEMRLRDLYRVGPHKVWGEILILIGLLVVVLPAVQLPNAPIATLLFGDAEVAYDLFFRPMPVWLAYICLVFFPLTHIFAELPTYFGYVMPRLAALSGKRWAAVLLVAFFLAAQHCALPLLFDWRFVLWRLLMFLPLALILAVVLSWRPRLLPYMMVLHGLLDFPLVLMILAL